MEQNTVTELKCDGKCEGGCSGEVVPIEIVGGDFDGQQYNYCEKAIAHDEGQGYIIRKTKSS